MHRTNIIACVVFIAVVALSSTSEAYKDDRAPDSFHVVFNTTQGLAKILVVREWAPIGVDRFYTLLKENYYDDNAFFRVIRSPKPFVAQWGISSTPSIAQKWENANLENDPVVKSNIRGYITYAAEMATSNTTCCRSTQIYVNYGDNSRLDALGFAPFAQVISGMDVLDKLYSKYGEEVDQGSIYQDGSKYLKKNFPNLDYLLHATIVPK